MALKTPLAPKVACQPDSLIAQPGKPIKTKGKWLKLALRFTVTILIFFFLLRSVAWTTLVSTILHARHGALLMGLVAGVACIVFSAYAWRVLVLAERIPADLARLINLYLVGIAFSHFLPTSVGGDVAKAYYVGRDSGNITGATSAVLMSRITGFLGMLLIALPGIVIWHTMFTASIIESFLLLSFLLLAMIGGAIVFSALLPRLSSRFSKNRWMTYRAVGLVFEVGQTVTNTIKKPQVLCASIGFAMLFWIASFLNYYGFALALNMQVPLPFYIIAIELASMAAFFPLSINGFGVREGTLVFVFSTMHVAPGTALSLAFLVDIQALFFGLIGGGIYLTMGAQRKPQAQSIYERLPG